MLTCPRCGNPAEYLHDEVFSLLRCEFCGDVIDATDEVLRDEVERIARTVLTEAAVDELLPRRQPQPA
jgi:uncharacterized Zn finger protein